MFICSLPENMAEGLLDFGQWVVSRINDNYLCGFGVFSTRSRWWTLSFTMCESSNAPARELDTADIPAWTALFTDGRL
jgi:hypothetical protein